MENEVTIYFDSPKSFEPSNIRPLNGITGLYFIFSQSINIQYPFDTSKLLYIGMSERKTNSIGSRLLGHFNGKSKNVGLMNYRKIKPLLFTYINFEMLKNIWQFRIEDLESYFILNFVKHYGVYPICNNKTGFEILNNTLSTSFKIDWNYFK
ncbi:MAG: GIY-YIG nuclease family protein [Bacteroidetes bacterium]|nr:GIY-YIG nuclease family protein [Bacteroidota bacterium]